MDRKNGNRLFQQNGSNRTNSCVFFCSFVCDFCSNFFITSYSKEEEEKTNKLGTQFQRILRPFCVSLFRFVCSSSTLVRSLTCSIDMECSGVVQKG